jgi:hypothetical protein
MKVLIWTGAHDPLDATIKFLTHGRGTHAAFLRSDGVTIHEAFYPRVRDRLVTPEDKLSAEVYDVYELWQSRIDDLERLFDRHLRDGIEYSIMDLFRYALNRPSKDEKHTFCSRYVLYCLKQVMPHCMPLVRIPNRDWASPRDLRISPRLIPSGLPQWKPVVV